MRHLAAMPFLSRPFLRSLGLGFVLGALGVLAAQGLGTSTPAHGVVPAAQAAPSR
ncbi:MAG: hypothetical protein JSS36_11335 [Proteobacteria bacterium]|nr:hypothetical protein [Pseudomonadota bacterium]